MNWAIVLYGSVARGTAGSSSDVDVLVIGTPPHAEIERAAAPYPGPLSTSFYDWDEIDGMRNSGSIFLRHVGREGKLLAASGRGARVMHDLASLPPYAYVRRDLENFTRTLADVAQSLDEGGSPRYELSVVLGLIRHCAILGAYLNGQPDFRTAEPLVTLQPICKLEETRVARFEEVYRQATRPSVPDGRAPTAQDVAEWHDFATRLLSCVKGLTPC